MNTAEERLRAKGYDPAEIRSKLQNYIGPEKAFADTREYARTVRDKQAAGEELQDPHTAAAMQAITPSHYGETETKLDFGTPREFAGQLTPGATGLVNAILEHRHQHPTTLPIEPGAKSYPMMRDEVTDEQWQMTWDRDQERWEWETDFKDRQLAQQLAIAGMSRSGGVAAPTQAPGSDDRALLRHLSGITDTPMIWDINAPPPQIQAASMDLMMGELDPMTQIRSLVEYAVSDGGQWDDIESAIDRQLPALRQEGVNYAEALQWAFDEYERLISQAYPGRFTDPLQGFVRDQHFTALPGARDSVFGAHVRDPYEEAVRKQYIDTTAEYDPRLYR